MTFFNENLGNRILELLGNTSLIDRCSELAHIFERCSLRELQEVFPRVVSGIFGMGTGGLGWGLRAMTKENTPQCFDMLMHFFMPTGPMLRLCYRLLNDSIKFEFSLDVLPHKVAEMLQSGQYPMFYADLLNIDPFRRQVTSLSLNAFDYYMLHFVIHATFPLHKMYPAALQVHNERLKTAYLFLTADYLSTFLPSSPEGIVFPTNICPTVKAAPQIPVTPLQPRRTPKYLKIPHAGMFSSTPLQSQPQNAANADIQRAHSWRTESVLHFFIDIWLRYDIGETRDLPSSEFVRVTRILVKQIHAFSNSANFDQTTMSTLRKIAQPMMRARIYPFLRSIINRWPLDNSLSVVLELWLSYLQPWRYTNDWESTNSQHNVDSANIIQNRYDTFIAENLLIYTQIFASLLPRFERLDFTSLRNVVMLHRLVKVFSQNGLPEKLYHSELTYSGNSYNFDTPQKHASYFRKNQTPSPGRTCEWDSSYFQEEYTPLFGPAIRTEIEQFLKTVQLCRLYIQQEINSICNEMQKQRDSLNFFKKILSSFFCEETQSEQKLKDIVKIPDLLDLAMRSLSHIFQIESPSITIEQLKQHDQNNFTQNFSIYDNSDCLDFSRFRLKKDRFNSYVNLTYNPDLIPVQSHECGVLVRLFNEISNKLNELLSEQMQNYWQRSDFVGKAARQILSGPTVVQWFDKPRGFNELCEKQLPPRICLRPLASYRILGVLLLWWLIFLFLWGSPIFGIFISMLILLYVSYVSFMALIST